MQRNLKNGKTPNTNKGITLVALVITIIVLLILAGVAINMAINSDGLFGKANEATEKWNESVKNEGMALGSLMDELEKLSPTPDVSGANGPKVPGGVKVQYVTWQEDATVEGKYNEVLSETRPENWHNYNEKKWANIKTTATSANSDGTYNSAYWVWIPRYAYQVPAKPTSTSNSGAPEFKIAFLQGTSNTPVDSSVLNGATIKTDTSAGVSEGDWVVHPAFDFGGTPLSGIWVAKFEASSNAPNTVADGGGNSTSYQVQVLPSVPSWRSVQVTTMFEVCQNMTVKTGALEGNTTADPHMMKNVEWGAVTYLAQSQYGKNAQVWNNPYYQSLSTAWNDSTVSVSDNKVMLTGKVAKESTATNLADAINSNTTEFDSYNVGNGPEGSTTGNVYGVYDMAGGSGEYTAAYLNNSSAQSSTYITKLIEANEKYKDVYEVSENDSQQDNYDANTKKYGDAIYETSYQGTDSTSWQNDYSWFRGSSNQVFMRGGSCNDSTPGGVFSFGGGSGDGHYYHSFRPVCVAQ